jgi:XTP/dITP diphosphohydrolase
MSIIFFASENPHKKVEFEQLFPGFDLTTPAEMNTPFSPEEKGASFVDNAFIKAKTLWEIVRKPVLADDSGICVDILDGRPGIRSARYGGNDISGRPIGQFRKNQLLIAETDRAIAAYRRGKIPLPADMNPHKLRVCRFVCALVLYINPWRFFAVQETLEGSLVASIEQAAGSDGFGYDPIVLVTGDPEARTVAQLAPEEKNRLSHRGKAARALLKIIP